MKIIYLIFIIIVCYSLSGCNNNNSVPTTGSSGKPDTLTNKDNEEPGLAKTDRGREVFQEKCVACHGLGGSARSNNAANLEVSVLDSLAITQVIKNGRGTMPMFKDALADSDIGHLAVYVKSLRD